jgi:hypothetical protein
MTASRQRAEKRCEHIHLIEYSHHADNYEEALKGITANLSHSGLCLYVFKPHKKGDSIVIRKGLRADRPATVLWHRRLDDRLFKVGLRFE